jgi:hypothetical protein
MRVAEPAISHDEVIEIIDALTDMKAWTREILRILEDEEEDEPWTGLAPALDDARGVGRVESRRERPLATPVRARKERPRRARSAETCG